MYYINFQYSRNKVSYLLVMNHIESLIKIVLYVCVCVSITFCTFFTLLFVAFFAPWD